MKELIRYSHCVKWTLGQLDREPHSQYESRTVEVELSVWREDNEDEWIVKLDGKILANEPCQFQAVAIAAYELMNKSRWEAEQEAKLKGLTWSNAGNTSVLT